MRIAHLVCRFPPYVGGMGQVAFEQVSRLAKMGHQVAVFTLPQQQRLNPDKLNFKIEYLKAFPRLGNGGFCPQLLWRLRGFDIIQLHYPFFGAQEILWLAKKLRIVKAKLIIFYHMDASFKSWFVKILSFKSWLIRKSLFELADKICCASLDYVQHSKAKSIYQKQPEKFIEIPFGSNQKPDLVDQNKLVQLKEDLNIKLQDKVVLFVGGLDSAHYFKGVPVLIEAIHKLKDRKIKLIIVGDGNLRDDFERQVSGLNIKNQVIFVGRASHQELAYYYKLCIICVLPSTSPAEAFGLVLVEAKAFGKPVIGSELPGVRGVVGKSGLTVKPGDANNLAEKIKIILTDNFLADKFSRLALQETEEKYNWDKHVIKLNQLY